MHFVDVHTHLTHARFQADCEAVIAAAKAAGVGAMIVNGLEPDSNRAILAMAARHPEIKAALGIYPVDAVCDILPPDFALPVRRFDVQAEIAFIRAQALAGKLIAIGECGLDGHWLAPETFAAQERVFERLIGIALEADLPLIIHTRKLEARSMEILRHHGVKRVNFHCFGGKLRLAQQGSEHDGWWFSIPANARHNDGFRGMLKSLPVERLLTETDAPYLGPTKGQRNEPKNVVLTVQLFAELRGLSEDEAQAQIFRNYVELFAQNPSEPNPKAQAHSGGVGIDR